MTLKRRTSILSQSRSISAELEKLLKIFMSSLLKSLKVNKKYTVPGKAVRIKKNKNNKGGLLYRESCSMFNFSDMLGEKDAMSIYRLNKRTGTR